MERGCEQTLPRRSRDGDAQFLELRAGVAFFFAARKTPHYFTKIADTGAFLAEVEHRHSAVEEGGSELEARETHRPSSRRFIALTNIIARFTPCGKTAVPTTIVEAAASA